jgi:hypothetical protein
MEHGIEDDEEGLMTYLERFIRAYQIAQAPIPMEEAWRELDEGVRAAAARAVEATPPSSLAGKPCHCEACKKATVYGDDGMCASCGADPHMVPGLDYAEGE